MSADQPRGKTKNARRTIALDDTTLTILAGGRGFQAAEFTAVGITNDEGWVFTDGDGEPVHPHAVHEAFRRIVHNAGVPTIRFHDLRHTHGSLLIKDGIPVKVVSERLGHDNIGGPPEQVRLNRGNTSATTKAQVADLGLRAENGGGGRI